MTCGNELEGSGRVVVVEWTDCVPPPHAAPTTAIAPTARTLNRLRLIAGVYPDPPPDVPIVWAYATIPIAR
jgi:hypothetical protein